MKFYKVSINGWRDINLIAANNTYEAVGYYLLEELGSSDCVEDVQYEALEPDYEIEVSCVGWPEYKTVEKLYNELDSKELPCIVCRLIE